jgi:hypothetical protein
VPADVACVEIDVAGARDVVRRFDVTADEMVVLSLTGLPLGTDTFTGLAYPMGCSAVTSPMQATWISDPVQAALVAQAVADVSLVLRPNGQTNVCVGFQADDAGPDDSGCNSFLIASTPLLQFPPTPQGVQSSPLSLTISNSSTGGSGPLSFVLSVLSGNLGDFAIQLPNPCTGPIPAGRSCTVEVTFTPSTESTEAGTLTVSATPGASVPVLLQGTGECLPGSMRACNTHPGLDGVGICHAGSQTCVASSDNTASSFGPCAGDQGPLPRDCTSSLDHQCVGRPDNTIDSACQCAPNSTQACMPHPGLDGIGICTAGSMTCNLGPNNSSSSWGSCSGSVGPDTTGTWYTTPGWNGSYDWNCDGVIEQQHDHTWAQYGSGPCDTFATFATICSGYLWPNACRTYSAWGTYPCNANMTHCGEEVTRFRCWNDPSNPGMCSFPGGMASSEQSSTGGYIYETEGCH